MPMWGYPSGYGMGGMFWVVGSVLLGLIVVSLLLWYALSVIERRSRSNLVDDAEPGALETLQRRFARGEIDEQTFLRMREQLPPGEGVTPSEQAARR